MTFSSFAGTFQAERDPRPGGPLGSGGPLGIPPPSLIRPLEILNPVNNDYWVGAWWSEVLDLVPVPAAVIVLAIYANIASALFHVRESPRKCEKVRETRRTCVEKNNHNSALIRPLEELLH